MLYLKSTRKPVVLCIDDMRIQVDVNHNADGRLNAEMDAQERINGGQRKSLAQVVNKLMSWGSVSLI